MPQIGARLARLKELKDQGSLIIPRLEARFDTTIEALLEKARAWEADSFLRGRNQCWEQYGPGPAGYFY